MVVALNSSNARHLTGVSENGGVTFFQAQCDVHVVHAERLPGVDSMFGNPVAAQLGRGRDYYFPNHFAWDQAFFYRHGLRCIRNRGFGEAGLALRELADLTMTSIPWPLVDDHGISHIANVTDYLYCAGLVTMMMVAVSRRRRRRRTIRSPTGPRILAAQLAMVIPVTITFGSEPRYRIAYDVLGLALAAWFIAEWLRAPQARPPSRWHG